MDDQHLPGQRTHQQGRALVRAPLTITAVLVAEDERIASAGEQRLDAVCQPGTGIEPVASGRTAARQVIQRLASGQGSRSVAAGHPDLIGGDQPAVAIDHPDGQRQGIDDAAGERLGVFQTCLAPLLLGHILQAADQQTAQSTEALENLPRLITDYARATCRS